MSTTEPEPAGRKTILVVEDERIVARDIQKSLSDLGYFVPRTAASGEQAIQIASDHRPDLVIMDVRINGERDGIEVASVLRERFDVPVVYLTACADEVTLSRAKQSGPFGYLLKPTTKNALRSAVEIALFKHETEKQLRERERWLATTMRCIGEGVISTDASGVINYMNPVAEQLTGWRDQAARGHPAAEVVRIVDERSHLPCQNPLDAVLRDACPDIVDGLLCRATGPDLYVSNSSSPILAESGEVMGVVMVLHDMTRRRELQRRLELADRLATVGTMAAGVAHEVNNPLAYIRGNVSWSLDTIRKWATDHAGAECPSWTGEVETALSDAAVGASRVAKIVRDLNTFTRAGPETSEPASLSDIVDWSLEVVGHELRPRSRIVRRFEPTPMVDAPSGRLGQVFVNLLLNAAHALDGHRHELNELVIVLRTDEQGRAVVEIRDNGRGMSPEVLSRAREPFFTTKPVGQGTGLGLFVCHGIIDALGGLLSITSEPGHGTVAQVILPAHSQARLAWVDREIITVSSRSSLMVVDDEAMVRDSIRRTLGAEHTITCAKTSLEALALIVGGMRFDLVLCDMMMPHLNGMELYDEVRRSAPEQAPRMVFMDGGAYIPQMVEFLHAVPNPRIEKPFDPPELRRLIGELLREQGPITPSPALASIPS